MPHQCTNCGRRFPDGSQEMLSGCPDCGGKKFQYTPSSRLSNESADANSQPTTESQSTLQEALGSAGEADEATDESSTAGESARRPADRDDRSSAGSRTGKPERDSLESGTDAMEDDFAWVGGEEDDAQANARSDVVSPADLPAHGGSDASDRSDASAPDPSPADVADRGRTEPSEPRASDTDRPDRGRVVSEPTSDQPSVDQLRQELNEQFEGIKIISPGQYELNLMELYDREEHIVCLQEDGRYVINVPESWHS